jgi:hypothetical protein
MFQPAPVLRLRQQGQVQGSAPAPGPAPIPPSSSSTIVGTGCKIHNPTDLIESQIKQLKTKISKARTTETIGELNKNIESLIKKNKDDCNKEIDETKSISSAHNLYTSTPKHCEWNTINNKCNENINKIEHHLIFPDSF